MGSSGLSGTQVKNFHWGISCLINIAIFLCRAHVLYYLVLIQWSGNPGSHTGERRVERRGKACGETQRKGRGGGGGLRETIGGGGAWTGICICRLGCRIEGMSDDAATVVGKVSLSSGQKIQAPCPSTIESSFQKCRTCMPLECASQTSEVPNDQRKPRNLLEIVLHL